jgi:hypothetical protein
MQTVLRDGAHVMAALRDFSDMNPIRMNEINHRGILI